MHRFLILCLMAIVLSACVSPRLKPVVSKESERQWQLRQQQLQALVHWSIRGRVAIFVGEDVHNVGLNWQRKAENNTLKLEAPFSQGVVQLQKNRDGVTLTTAEGEQYSGQDSQQLLYQTTGLVIPVEGLQTWIKGIPHLLSSEESSLDAQGKAVNLQQDGWSINYLEYTQVSWPEHNDPQLPRKLYLKHDGLALKIVIDQWQNPIPVPAPDIFPVFN